jgi:hypothetical protein
MEQSANFAAVARDIRAEQADHDLAKHDMHRRWRAEIDHINAAIPILSEAAQSAYDWIEGANLNDQDVAAICCALFRELDRNAHIEKNSKAMAALLEVAEDFGSVE